MSTNSLWFFFDSFPYACCWLLVRAVKALNSYQKLSKPSTACKKLVNVAKAVNSWQIKA